MLLLVLCNGVAVTMGFWMKEVEERKEWDPKPDKMFLMRNSKRMIKTDAGEMRVLESYGGRIMDRRLHIGFITMEPRSLFVPQYLDSTFIIFVRAGIRISPPFLCLCHVSSLFACMFRSTMLLIIIMMIILRYEKEIVLMFATLASY